MSAFLELVYWLKDNYEPLLKCLAAIIGAGELVTALIPSKSGNGFMHHLGEKMDKIMDFLKIPYAKRAETLELTDKK